MAETIEGLYLRIGLKYDELNKDFLAVEETLNSNIARLNRQNRLIDLKAKIDLTSVTDAAQKLKIQQDALNRQIEIAKQKLKLYEAAWIDAAKATGAASEKAQKAEIALKQQQLALAQLSQRLKDIKAQQAALPKDNPLLSGYNNIKGTISGAIGQITSAFQGLNEASGSAGTAITKSLEIIDSIPYTAGKVVAALAAIPLVVKGIENSLLNLAEPAISAGDAMYVLSRGLQMSIADTAKFNMICKVTGIEVSEVTATIRRLQSQIVKASEDGTKLTKMLQKYGVEARNAKGDIKDINELSVALAEGLKKAQEVGKSREFIAALGRGVSADFITYLEDLEGNIGLADEIVKNGLADPKKAHDVQGQINAMNAQAAQLGSAFSSALLPIADVIVPKIRERTGELVKVIEQNADSIKRLGFQIADVVDTISSMTTAIAKLSIESAKFFNNTSPDNVSFNDVLARHKEDAEAERNYTAFLKAELEHRTELRKQALMSGELSFTRGGLFPSKKLSEEEATRVAEYEKKLIENNAMLNMQFQTRLKSSWAQVKKLWKDQADEAEKAAEAQKKLEDTWKTPFSDDEWNASLERIKKYDEEIAKLKLDLQFGDNHYGKSLAELEQWYRQALNEANGFEQDRTRITEEYSLKRAIIERDHAAELQKTNEETQNRIKQLTQETANLAYEATHSAFEKELRDIEKWKQAQLDKAQVANEVQRIIKNAAVKEASAIQREVDRIKGSIQSLEEKIFAQEHSQRDNDIYRAQKERAQMLKEGLPADRVQHWYENEIAIILDREDKDKDNEYAKNPEIYFRHEKDNAWETIYGDFPDKYSQQFDNFYDKLQSDVQENFENQYSELVKAAEQANQALAQIETDSVNEKLSEFGTAINGTTDILKQATKTLAEIKPDINVSGNESVTSQSQIPLSNVDDNSDTINKVLDGLQTLGKIAELGGTAATATGAGATIGVPLIIGGSATDILADVAQQVYNANREQPTPNIGADNSTTPNLDFSNLTTSANQAAEALNKIPQFIDPLQASLDNLNTAIQGAESSTISFANTLSSISNDIVAELATIESHNISNLPNIPIPSGKDFSRQDFISSGLQSADVNVELKQLNQLQSQHLPQIEAAMQPLNQMTQQLADLSQTAGSIAQSVNNDKARTITIAPNVTVSPNINLGGAYVFDNQMKQRLTDDITSNVANAVTDAVNKATSNIGYGYGN